MAAPFDGCSKVGQDVRELFHKGVPSMDENRPLYIISSAADLLGVHPRTLHLYEEKGLIAPARKGNRRFYSDNDLEWIRNIRHLIHKEGLNLEGLRRLLALISMLQFQGASKALQNQCRSYVNRLSPCWEEGSNEFDCHDCSIYLTSRERLLEDKGNARLAV
jgi:MerR family transcriptional regulator/heat shock protein HspR